MKQVLIIFIGGGAGSVLRYLISKATNYPDALIPYGTFFVNIIGSLLIGLILGYTIKHNTPGNITLLLATGFCGGFTTFSTFAYENFNYLKSGDYMSFGIYSMLSLSLGIIAVLVGLSLSKVF